MDFWHLGFIRWMIMDVTVTWMDYEGEKPPYSLNELRH